MSATFRLKVERSGADVTICLQGDFDGDSAWELANALMVKSNGGATVRIDTRQVRTVEPFGAALMKNLLSLNLIRSGRIFFDDICAERAVDGAHRLFGGEGAHLSGTGCRSRASIR